MSKPRLTQLTFTDDALLAHLQDGRAVSCPLSWFPKLLAATTEQRQAYTLSSGGIGAHWPALDEDLSAEGFLTYTPKNAPSASIA